MNLTEFKVEVPLSKQDGSSLERKATASSLNVSKDGSLRLQYQIEATDTTGETFVSKTNGKQVIDIGERGMFPNRDAIDTEEPEPEHLVKFKEALALATANYLTVELKDK